MDKSHLKNALQNNVPTNGDLKAHMKSVLQHHVGKLNAIPRRDLQTILFNMNDRAMRQLEKELVHEGLPVLFSTNRKNGGYYLPASRAELAEGLKRYQSYIIELCRDYRDVKLAGRRLLEKPVPPMQERLL